MALFVGVDPGGKNAFGWCVLHQSSSGRCEIVGNGTSSNAQDVLSSIFSICSEEPLAAGIDAPLYWSPDMERVADQQIRKMVSRFGGHSATVGHVNSLRGACLVQGVLAAAGLAGQWSQIKITESHPKALLHVWAPAREFVEGTLNSLSNEHERDAALGAYSAMQCTSQQSQWKDWVHLERKPFFPSGARVAYWFPDLA